MSNQTSFNLISNDIFVGNMMDSFMEGSDDFHPYLDMDEFDMSFRDDLEFVDCIECQGEHEHVQDRRRLSLTFMRRLSISSTSPEEFCITDGPESFGSEVTPDAPVSSTSSALHNSILSLLSAAELEQQLEQTKSRLTQSMERSELSRQQINSQASHSAVPASVLSQSRDRFASYMGGMTSMTRTLG